MDLVALVADTLGKHVHLRLLQSVNPLLEPVEFPSRRRRLSSHSSLSPSEIPASRVEARPEPLKRLVLDDLATMRRREHLASADVENDVLAAVREDQVSRSEPAPLHRLADFDLLVRGARNLDPLREICRIDETGAVEAALAS